MMSYKAVRWFVITILVSMLLFHSVSTRSWYLADEREIFEVELSPTINQRKVFHLDSPNGKIKEFAVNFKLGNQIFISDVGDNEIIAVTIDPNWTNPNPVISNVTIVRNQVAVTMTFDQVEQYLFFATVNQIWRVKPDGKGLKNVYKLDSGYKILAMEFYPNYRSNRSEIVWSVWKEEEQTGTLMKSLSPRITCTTAVHKGQEKFSSFSIVETSLYAIDSFNFNVKCLDLATLDQLSTNQTKLNDSSVGLPVKRRFEAFNSSTATSLFVDSVSRMVYVDTAHKSLMYCVEGQKTCNDVYFVTQNTLVDIKVNQTINTDNITSNSVQVRSFKQRYFFSNSVPFQFDIVSKSNIGRFIYSAQIKLISTLGQQVTETEQRSVVEVITIQEIQIPWQDKFAGLVDTSEFEVKLFYKEKTCDEDMNDYEELGSYVVCTAPNQPYDFEFDGSDVYWKHKRPILPDDWIISVKGGSLSSSLSFDDSQSKGHKIDSASELQHFIFRYQNSAITSNSSLTVIAQYKCRDQLVRSQAVTYKINNTINDVTHLVFHKKFKNTPTYIVRDKTSLPVSTSQTLLFIAIGILLVGIITMVIKKCQRKTQYKAEIDPQIIEENVVRFSTLRRSVISTASAAPERHLLNDGVVGGDGLYDELFQLVGPSNWPDDTLVISRYNSLNRGSRPNSFKSNTPVHFTIPIPSLGVEEVAEEMQPPKEDEEETNHYSIIDDDDDFERNAYGVMSTSFKHNDVIAMSSNVESEADHIYSELNKQSYQNLSKTNDPSSESGQYSVYNDDHDENLPENYNYSQSPQNLPSKQLQFKDSDSETEIPANFSPRLVAKHERTSYGENNQLDNPLYAVIPHN